ncbi:DUF222 domain-containing protein [Leifsonia sp. A12D58]|uniref:HNH endonuclease signature motif containing protein n=1 Tax=Leifsonia sp. A12D58 TaxID=3397674 RepID=UPI0039E1ACD0
MTLVAPDSAGAPNSAGILGSAATANPARTSGTAGTAGSLVAPDSVAVAELSPLDALDHARRQCAAALARIDFDRLGDDDSIRALGSVEALGRLADTARVSTATTVERRSAKWLGKDSLARQRGCHNGSELITVVTRVSGREVAHRLKLGKHVLPRHELTQIQPPLFPAVAAALAGGDLGIDAAEAIVTGLSELRARVNPDLLEVAEEALVAAATGLESESTEGMPNAGFPFDADSIRGQVTVWAARLDPDGAAPNEDIYEARSNIGFGPFRNGLYPLRGGVTPELRGIMDGITDTYLSAHTETPGNGGLLPDAHLADPDGAAARDAATAATTATTATTATATTATDRDSDFGTNSDSAFPDSSGITGPVNSGPAFPSAAEQAVEQAAQAARQARIDAGELPDDPIPFDDRTTNEKRADIFRAVFDHAARDPKTPTMGGSAPTVMVHVNARDLADDHGVGWIDGVEAPVSMRTVKQMICAGGFQEIVLGGNNEVLELGHEERFFNRRQRRAMAARDGGCVIPGCTAPPAWTEGHHVIPWAINQKTDISNGVLLCWYHHHSIETSGWKLRMVNGAPQVKAPPWLDPTRTWRPGGQHRATASSTSISRT